MNLPSYTDYQAAVQNPQLAFQHDPDLRVSRVETDQLDRPRVRSGNFAYTYRFDGRGKRWAVRCFSKYVPEQRRYQAVSRFLAAHPIPFLLRTSFLPQGALVNGGWHPIIKMDWAEGETLGEYVERNAANAQILERLLARFQNMVTTLERSGIAHGDLQHGNILVKPNGDLVLVDYDGFYVPDLSGLQGMERGHRHYQHPVRDKEFSPYLDRFSTIVIYLALRALALNPALQRYNTGENLLFKQDDFGAPDQSRLLSDLAALPELAPLAARFRTICMGNLAQVPRLSDFLSGEMVAVAQRRQVSVRPWETYSVMPADQREALLAHVGERVTVVGKITEYAPKQTRTAAPKPYVFLTFGDWHQQVFRLIVWSGVIPLFQSQNRDLSAYQGSWVSVTGLLTEHQSGGWPQVPQIMIDLPSQIEILPGGEKEAQERLDTQSTSPSTSSQASEAQTSQGAKVKQPRGQPAATKRRAMGTGARAVAPQVRPVEPPRGPRLAPTAERISAQQEVRPSTPKVPVIQQVRNWLTGGSLQAKTERAQEHYNQGVQYRKQGQLDKAIGEYQRAVQLRPDFAQAYNNLGWIYKLQGDLDKAIKAFETAVRSDPSYVRAQVNLGWALGDKGRYDQAIRVLEHAIEGSPEEASAHFYLGWVHEQRGRLDKAIPAYREAARIDPTYAEAHLHLGWICQQKALYSQSVAAFQAAVRAKPNHAEAYYYLGMAYKESGRTDKARRELEQAARLGHQGAQGVLSTMGSRMQSSNVDYNDIPF